MPNLSHRYKSVFITHQDWRQIGDKKIFARSIWEANYARYLQFLKEKKIIRDWEHEPKTFWFEGIKRGANSYKPDFMASHFNGTRKWYEVKGYLAPKDMTKIKRFRKYFPEEELVLVGRAWFRQNNAKLRLFIKDWEKG